MIRSVIKPGVLFALIPIAVTVLVYMPNLGSSLAMLDAEAYERVLYTTEFIETARMLFQDFQGMVVPGYYAPLGSISLMLDKWCVGSSVPDLQFTQLMNLLFHCINGLLTFVLFRALGAGQRLAGCATFLFLVHPIQVPSVLWFASRKTVMACTFYLVAYLSYARFCKTSSLRWYVVCAAGFVAGLLTKPSVVVLPAVLLICEVLGVFSPHQAETRVPSEIPVEGSTPGVNAPIATGSTRAGVDLKDAFFWKHRVGLILLFLMSAATCLATMTTETPAGLEIPFAERPFIAAAALAFYVSKALLPVNLMLLYPRWNVDLSDPLWWLPLVSLIVASGILVSQRRRIPAGLWWAAANFVAPLIPVIGFVRFGFFRLSFVSDHLMYLSMIGLAYGMVFLAELLAKSLSRRIKSAVIGVMAVYAGFLLVQTWKQAVLWSDPVQLWSNNLEKCPECRNVRVMLGGALMEAGQSAQALPYLQQAAKIQPDFYLSRMNLGAALFNLGRVEEAKVEFERALALNPGSPQANLNMGMAFLELGRISDAKRYLNKAIGERPDFAEAHKQLGLAHMKANDAAEALSHFRQAIRIRSDLADAHNYLGVALQLTGVDIREAAKEYAEAVRLNPEYAEAHYNLANVLLDLGNIPLAIQHYERVLQIDPGLYQAHNNLGHVYLRMSQFPKAIEHFREALRIRPDSEEAKRNLDFALKASQDTQTSQ